MRKGWDLRNVLFVVHEKTTRIFSCSDRWHIINAANNVILVLAALCVQSAAVRADDCTMSGQTQIVNFGKNLAGRALTVAADVPIGTLVYRDTGYIEPVSFTCTGYGIYVGFYISAALVGWGENAYSFTLKGTGLSFRVISGTSLYLGRPIYTATAKNYTVERRYELEVYKSGEVSAQQVVSPGLLGEAAWDKLTYLKVYLANPIVLNTASCQAPSVTVAMGDDYRLGVFKGAGDVTRSIKYNIGLNQCQSGIKKVTYSLKATTPVIDAQKGIVALSASSTAKGIGLKLMDESGEPIVLGETYQFKGFDTTGKSFNIPLSAAYYRLANSRLEAGTANVEVVFIVNYL